jgi:hypothetical protein
MSDDQVKTVGDLIQFLSQLNPALEVTVYDYEYGQNNPLQGIDVNQDHIVLYP